MLVTEDGNTPADEVGKWEPGDEEEDDVDEEGEPLEPFKDEERKADDQRIRHMLVRAPADRAWRRRGWLLLARYCPAKMQLAHNNDSGGGGGGFCISSESSTKTAKACYGGDRSRRETADLARLVGRVVGLDVEGVFRFVVGFL